MSTATIRFLSCTLGMLAGLVCDASAGRLAMLTALCARGNRDVLYWLQLHGQQLPAMHIGMLIGAAAAMALSFPSSGIGRQNRIIPCARHTVCLAFMLAGMNLGMLAHMLRPASTMTIALMLAGMIAGMFCGQRVGEYAFDSRIPIAS